MLEFTIYSEKIILTDTIYVRLQFLFVYIEHESALKNSIQFQTK